MTIFIQHFRKDLGSRVRERYCQGTEQPDDGFDGITRFPLPSDGRGIKGEGAARKFYSTLWLFRGSSLTPALSHPMGEGETLGRARQRSRVRVVPWQKNETFFRWFLRLVFDTAALRAT